MAKVKPLPTSKADEGTLPETKNVFKASEKVINGSDTKDWKKIAKNAKRNIK